MHVLNSCYNSEWETALNNSVHTGNWTKIQTDLQTNLDCFAYCLIKALNIIDSVSYYCLLIYQLFHSIMPWICEQSINLDCSGFIQSSVTLTQLYQQKKKKKLSYNTAMKWCKNKANVETSVTFASLSFPQIILDFTHLWSCWAYITFVSWIPLLWTNIIFKYFEKV